MDTVNPDTLVRTVGANVPIPITARNVKVNVTVVKTAVMFQLDAQMSQQVSHVQYFFKKLFPVYFKQSFNQHESENNLNIL